MPDEQTAEQADVEVRIAGGPEQLWGDRDPRSEEEMWGWKAEGSLVTVNKLGDVLPYLKAYQAWQEVHSAEPEPSTRLVIELLTKSGRDPQERRKTEEIHVYLEPTVSRITRGDLKSMTSEIFGMAREIIKEERR